jgi:phosphatidylserine/phosphatidylglycerophosphate/cardiolipin synthase-like enzyme
MKTTQARRVFGVLLVSVSLLFSVSGVAGHPTATLVQSVPEGTDLGQPGMPEAKATWIEMVNGAKRSIDIEQMYVSGDSGTSRATGDVINALEAASARGVKIRLILASNMIDTDPIMLARLKKIPTLTLGVVDYGKITGGIQHTKFWIVDRKEFFLGSQNFDYLALTQIHEFGVRVEDRRLSERLHSVFELDWKIALTGAVPSDLGKAPRARRNADIEMVASPPVLNPEGFTPAIDALKALLASAKHSVRIQVMNYSTYSRSANEGQWLEIDHAIRAAAARGVKVQFLVSHWNTEKPGIESIKSLSQVKNVELRICTVPDLPTGHTPYSRVIHSKYMIVDDAVLWLGSSNWSKGYFDATRGIELILKRTELAESATRMFNTVWTAPYSVPVDVNRDYPKPIK